MLGDFYLQRGGTIQGKIARLQADIVRMTNL